MTSVQKMNPTTMLNSDAALFKMLRDNPPKWWDSLVEDPELYIEIRKDNKIHVYYYGARMAEIALETGSITAKCHAKYIHGKDCDKDKYESCLHNLSSKKGLSLLKNNARECYLKNSEGEDTAEKRIQGRLRIDNTRRYIDSEFEHSYFETGKNNTMIRFDLVAVDGNELKIEELKRIGDSRMRTADMATRPPEILEQMERYSKFMLVNKDALCIYYQTLIEIKSQLGLPTPIGYDKDKPLSLDLTPLLLIKNLYQYSKMGNGRYERIKDIRQILEKNKIKYFILP